MSLRTSFRTAQSAYRSFSTSIFRSQLTHQPETPQAGPSSASKPSGSFDDLSAILSAPIPQPSQYTTTLSSSNASPKLSESATSVEKPLRGYLPHALPPKVDPILGLFTNMLMKHGEKGAAQRKMINILSMIRETSNQAPLPLLHRAVLLSSPSVRVLNMRKSMKSVPTPRGMSERQRAHQAIKWILKASEKGRRPAVKREERIAREILAILEGESDVFKWVAQRHKEATLARSNIFAR